MGRKKNYSKNAKVQKPSTGTAGDSENPEGAEGDEGVEGEAAVVVPAGEGAEIAASGVAALTGGTQAPTLEPATPGTPGGPALEGQVLTGRPEWALAAPARLEAAEEESFWYAFALAVMACAPPALGAPAAVVAAILGGRILRALWSVPADVAPDDLGNARMMLFGTVLLSAAYRLGQNGMMGMAWVMITVFFFNALRNVRVMVNLALTKGGAKKKKGQKEIPATTK